MLKDRMGYFIPINNRVLYRHLGIIDGNPTLLDGNDLYAVDMNSNRIELRIEIWKLKMNRTKEMKKEMSPTVRHIIDAFS